ncbi:MAG: ACP phosphodiesterase [Desulfuromonadaceae bacterium]|nr:ACP phosphodiesterase [Desulfuromonadaceae bacterium]
MNFLFHMLLSGDDEQILVGNFMGDFVKGPLAERFPVRIRKGITLHRSIDSFASRADLFQQSRRRLDSDYGLYRGVMIDLFYDHILVTEWNDWSNEPLDNYLVRTREIITRHHVELPERLQIFLPSIFEELLPSYGQVSGIGLALERMSRRVARPNPLAGGEAELVRHFDGLRSDFRGFMPLIRRFAEETLADDVV